MTDIHFRYRIVMESDWHVGSGGSLPGLIDRLVARDTDDLPFIPAKSVTGIWRDACETVAHGLDDGGAGTWSQWLSYLFGDQPADVSHSSSSPPRPAAVSLRPAYFPRRLREVLAARREFRDVLTFRKPGVQIDRPTGVAQEDMLRMEEMVRGGIFLEGDGVLALDARMDRDQVRAAWFLLAAGARLVRRLGGKRRRGHGACSLEVTPNANYADLSWDDLLAWVKAGEAIPGPPSFSSVVPQLEPVAEAAATSMKPGATPAVTGGWVVFDLRLQVRLPLVAGYRTTGNVVSSLDFLPGTYLLPVVTGALRERLGLDPDEIRRAVVTGDLIVLPATPEIEGWRGLPVPFCLFHKKDEPEEVYNRLVEEEPSGVQLKGYREGFVAEGNSGCFVYQKTEKTFHTHNSIDDQRQCPKSDKGRGRGPMGAGVYSYEAIAAGTILRAELRLRSPLAERLALVDSRWWSKLDGTYRVGRSKKDDYGLVALAVSEPRRFQPSSELSVENELFVWLTSPALLRAQRLAPSSLSEDLRRELESCLGVQLRQPNTDGQAELLDCVLQPFRWDGWHTGWGLPRPTLGGLQAGSCARFVMLGPKPPDMIARLAEVEARGIGERRAEGFGQVVFNVRLVREAGPSIRQRQKAAQHLDSIASAPPVDQQEGPEVYAYARLLERALWRDRIWRYAQELAWADGGKRNPLGVSLGRPTLRQFGSLRAVVRRLGAWDTGDVEYARAWLDGFLDNPRRAERWDPQTRNFLQAVFRDRAAIWSGLEEAWQGEGPPFPALTRDGEEALRNELWAEAVRALVEATADFLRAQRASAGGGGGGAGSAAS